MPQSFKCPTCNAALDYDGGPDLTITCPYCGNSVIVPEELRVGPAARQPAGDPLSQMLGDLREFAEITRLVRAGKKIEAIKLYRQATGSSLKDAKDAVEKMAAGRVVEVSSYTLNLGSQPAPAAPDQAARIAEIGRLLSGGNKIAAIKLYRETFGVGLAEAKEAIDKLETTVGTPGAFDIHPPAVTSQRARPAPAAAARPAGPMRGGCIALLILAVVALVALGLVASALAGSGQLASLFGGLAGTATAQPTNTRVPEPSSTPRPAATPTPAATATPGFAQASVLLGCAGAGRGCFEDARHIGLDGEGNIYVGEYAGGRVQVFDPSGEFIAQWRAVEEDNIIRRMAVGWDGVVYAVYNGNIYRHDGQTGEELGQVEYEGGQGFQDVAVTADGGLVATWNKDWQGGIFVNFSESQDDLVIFDTEGQVTAVLPQVISEIAGGKAELDTSVAVDVRGNIYLIGWNNAAIFKFSPEGKYLDKFGEGELQAVRAMAVDQQGRVFVSAASHILIFDARGRLLDRMDYSPEAMVFNDRDELFILDNPQVIKLELLR